MTPNLIFIDTNVLIEIFFRRAKYDLAIARLVELSEESIVSTSILSLSTLLYYVEAKGFDKKIAHNFMQGYKILDMNNADYEWAKNNDKGDFEDALQVACARRHGCAHLLTLDQKFEPMYGKYLSIRTIQNTTDQ
jgi:predicted nucleic acid-binding protein